MKGLFIVLGVGAAGFCFADVDFATSFDDPSFTHIADGWGPGAMSTSSTIFGTGGNPDSYMEIHTRWGNSAYEMYEAVTYDWTIDQSAGPWISSVDLSVDYRRMAQGEHPFLFVVQNGFQYIAQTTGNNTTVNTWLTETGHFNAHSFAKIISGFGNYGITNGADNPIFGSGGGVTKFYIGYDSSSTINLNNGFENFDYDNVHIHVNTVPEPTTGLLVIPSLAMLLIRRKKPSI